MWELIKANQRRSIFLFSLMGLLLMLLGFFIGGAYLGQDGWIFGLLIAFSIWLIMSLVSYYQGDSIILAMSGAKKVTREMYPQLYNVVEEMRISAQLPGMPDIYIIPDPAPNAFACGRKPEKCAIAVTAGLLTNLNRDELQGVIAHETSHILNRDILFMTFSGVLLGSIVYLSEFFLRSLWFTGGRSRSSRNSKSGGGQLQIAFMIAAIALAILSPLLAQLLYFSISRKREYLADATAVRLTRYPEGLASALEKISFSDLHLQSANKATAGLYIANPMNRDGMQLSNATSTHPPLDKRINILRSMSKGVNYYSYHSAYSRVNGSSPGSYIIPPTGMRDTENIPLRKARAEAGSPTTSKQKVREVNDIIKLINDYYFIPCACGLKIKIPQGFKHEEINCPRCGKNHIIPAAILAASQTGSLQESMDKTNPEPEAVQEIPKQGPLVYQKKGEGWETFCCSCGDVKQISPYFKLDKFLCSNCGREIIVKK